MIANSLPQKELGSTPMSSTPIEKEPVMECPLLLTTLSEATFKGLSQCRQVRPIYRFRRPGYGLSGLGH